MTCIPSPQNIIKHQRFSTIVEWRKYENELQTAIQHLTPKDVPNLIQHPLQASQSHSTESRGLVEGPVAASFSSRTNFLEEDLTPHDLMGARMSTHKNSYESDDNVLVAQQNTSMELIPNGTIESINNGTMDRSSLLEVWSHHVYMYYFTNMCHLLISHMLITHQFFIHVFVSSLWEAKILRVWGWRRILWADTAFLTLVLYIDTSVSLQAIRNNVIDNMSMSMSGTIDSRGER